MNFILELARDARCYVVNTYKTLLISLDAKWLTSSWYYTGNLFLNLQDALDAKFLTSRLNSQPT